MRQRLIGDRGLGLRDVHMYLRATVTATTVMARLTHGPHHIAPAITTSAKKRPERPAEDQPSL